MTPKVPETDRPASSKWVQLIIWMAICLAAAAIGTLMTTPGLREWYPSLNKPAWTPPNGVFAPVWTILYASMGLAAWMVWLQRASRNVAPAISIFVIQLILNVAWSGLFFGLHSSGAGLLTILSLWCAIAATIVIFHRTVALAGWILVPYLAWVSFALVLNVAIWRLNK
jgi:translocator protein